MIDFVIKANKKYYSETLQEECKYEQEKNLIDDELEKRESDESDSNSNEYDDECNE